MFEDTIGNSRHIGPTCLTPSNSLLIRGIRLSSSPAYNYSVSQDEYRPSTPAVYCLMFLLQRLPSRTPMISSQSERSSLDPPSGSSRPDLAYAISLVAYLLFLMRMGRIRRFQWNLRRSLDIPRKRYMPAMPRYGIGLFPTQKGMVSF